MNLPARQTAKRPITRAAGPYGHPFHPILVTVPIGAWVSSFVFDLVSQAAGEEAVFTKGAYVIDRVDTLGSHPAALRQEVVDRRARHIDYIIEHGQDMPEIRDWTWSPQ